MRATTSRRGFVVILAVLLLLSTVAGTVGADEPADLVSEPDRNTALTTEPGVAAAVTTINTTENVSTWNRAGLPFRIDDPDAAWTAPTGAVTVEYAPENTGQIDARRTATAVYRPGTANASFQSVTGAGTSQFAGEEAQLVVARLNATATAAPTPTAGSLGDLRSLLDPSTDEFNATYTVTDAGPIDDSGRLETTVPLKRPGNYVVFLATGGNFTAADGDLSLDGSGTVVGVDTAVVERAAAAVTDASAAVEPGADASVTVAPATNGTNVSVVLYHERTWVNSRTAVTVTDRITAGPGPPNATIGHSITAINGRTAVATPVRVAGTTYGDGRFSRATASELIDLVANRDASSAAPPNTTVIGDGTRLDAAVVAERNVSGATAIAVPTREDWSEGAYRWIVTADANRTSGPRTATGTLTVASDSGGFSIDSDRPELENAAFGSTVVRTPDSVDASIAGTTPGEPVRLLIPIRPFELLDRGYVVTGLTANVTRDVEGDLSVSTPDELPVRPVSADGQIGYIAVDHTIPNGSVSNATLSFVVSDRRLDDAGIDPDAVALFRLGPDGWNELPTRFLEETRLGYHFAGDSPGLSVYAIAESGAARPRFALNETALNRSEVRTNESIAVNATVVNRGTGPGSYTANLTVENRSVDTRTVRVPAGEQRTLRFTHRFGATPGAYTVRLANTTVATVTVTTPEPDTTASATQPNETAPSDDEPTTATDSASDPPAADEPAGLDLGSGRGVALIGGVALVGIGLALYRRYGGP